MTNRKGFTLIELLVVILVIGILATIALSVIDPRGLRQKARDSQRKADLSSIQTALEVYFADNQAYPVKRVWERLDPDSPTPSSVLVTALESGGYMNSVPQDPSPVGTNPGPCANIDRYRYNYKTNPNGTWYYLTSIMEIESSKNESPCGELSNWSTYSGCGASFTTVDYCYGVESP